MSTCNRPCTCKCETCNKVKPDDRVQVVKHDERGEVFQCTDCVRRTHNQHNVVKMKVQIEY